MHLPEAVVGKNDVLVEVVVMGLEIVVLAVLDIMAVDVVFGISVGVVLDNNVKVIVGVVGTNFVVGGRVFEAVLIDVAVAGVALGFDSTK